MYQNQFQMTASLPMAQENKINPQLDFYIRKTMKEEFMTLILPYQQNSSGQIAILEEKIQMLNNNYMLLLKNNMDKTPQMGIGTNDSIEKLEKKINEIESMEDKIAYLRKLGLTVEEASECLYISTRQAYRYLRKIKERVED
jgi:hypothetical protein